MAFEKENINHIPSMMEISEYIQNPVYDSFCKEDKDKRYKDTLHLIEIRKKNK